MKALYYFILLSCILGVFAKHSSKSLRKNRLLANSKSKKSVHHPKEHIQNRVKRSAAEGRLKRITKEKSHNFFKKEKEKDEVPLKGGLSIDILKEVTKFKKQKKSLKNNKMRLILKIKQEN